jgi:hypothetical protein
MSFKPKGGSATRRLTAAAATGKRISTARSDRMTHTLDPEPEARLRKGPGNEARLCVDWHALMENRNCHLVEACVT